MGFNSGFKGLTTEHLKMAEKLLKFIYDIFSYISAYISKK